MTKTNLPNPQAGRQLGPIRLLHGKRGFFSTARQRQLYNALPGAPCPPPDPNSGPDRLTLPNQAAEKK